MHGGLGNLMELNPVAEALAARFHLIGIDFGGYGRSTIGASSLTYAGHKRDVTAVLDHVGADRFSVLGFSDGRIVAYRLAVSVKRRVEAIVALGAQWHLRRSDPEYETLSGLTAERWDQMFPQTRKQYESLNTSPDFERLVESVVSRWADLGSGGYSSDAVRGIVAATLIVRGDGDIFLSLDEVAQLRCAIPGASLFNIPLAGHDMMADSPDLFLMGMGDFLEHPRKAPTQA